MSWMWRLDTGSESLEFGDDNAPIVVQDWSIEPGAMRVEDQERPGSDVLLFGRDLRSGQVINFSVWARGSDEQTALAGLAKIQTAWRNDRGRRIAGSLCTLEHPSGRFIFGRPRGFAPNTRRVEQGWVTASAVFEAVDDLWYGPEQRTVTRLAPTFTGGLPVPAAVPFVLGGGTGESDSLVQVDGDVATWPVFELHGPIQDPWIDVPGAGRLIFRGSLAYDQTLTVDTRPWARWVKRDGAPLPGALSPNGARLSDMSLRPGSYRIIFGGYDPSGTSSLSVRVWPAFTSF